MPSVWPVITAGFIPTEPFLAHTEDRSTPPVISRNGVPGTTSPNPWAKSGFAGIATAESFFSHPTTEMYHHHDFSNHMAARTSVMEYIESWYNWRRPHSYNQGLPPARALDEYQNQIGQAAA